MKRGRGAPPWTEADRRELALMRLRGMTSTAIARATGRTTDAVRRQCSRMMCSNAFMPEGPNGHPPGIPWAQADIDTLLAMRARDETIGAIAAAVEMSHGEVEWQVHKMKRAGIDVPAVTISGRPGRRWSRRSA